MPLPTVKFSLFLTIIAAIAFAVSSRAEDFYVAQTALGSGSGADSTNAKSVAFFNSSANWNAPTKTGGKIGPGDTVHLTGTISTTLSVQANGTASGVITILFEPGAKMSSPVWSNSSGAISVNAKNYITIDGGATGTIGGNDGSATLANGIIENTANGTGLANHIPSRGVQGINANNFVVKNLWVKNIYVRTSSTDVFDDDSSGISNKAANADVITGYTVTNCIVDNAYRGIEGDFGTGCSNYNFSYITAHHCNWGIGVGDRGPGKTLTGIVAHHVYVHSWTNWNDTTGGNAYHHNGIFFFTNNDSSLITAPTIYSCVFGPGFGNEYQTGAIYMNTGILNPLIYNNLFICKPGEFAGNGMIVLSSTSPTTFHVYNNTFVGGGAGESIHLYGSGTNIAQTMNVKNNLGVGNGGGTFIALYNTGGVTLNSDYNLGYGYNSGLAYLYSPSGNGVFKTYAEWRSLGLDAHGLSGNPSLDATFKTVSGSIAVDKGTSLLSIFATDKDGTPRPQGTAWDIGAFEVTSGSTPIVPPSDARTTITVL